jgi:cytochrome P450
LHRYVLAMADQLTNPLRLLFSNGIISVDIVVLVSCFSIVYVVVNAVYSLTLHPLAGIPGPRLCALSRVPYWRQCIKGKDVQWLHGLHKQYGPILRFGPTDLSYTDSDAWKDIHGREKGRRESEKAQEFSVQPVNGKASMSHRPYLLLTITLSSGVPSILTATQADHDRVRRIFSPAFSERALRKQEPLFQK